MSNRKQRIFDALERIEYFNQANQQLKTELSYTIELFLANRNLIADLNAAGITSTSAKSAGISGTQSKVARAEEIYQNLRYIRDTAKIIKKKIPGFVNKFRLPRGSLSYQQIIGNTESFIADAAQYESEFSQRGLNEDFFSDLAADLTEFKQIAQQQADAKRTSVGATADVEATLEAALDNRAELDCAIKNHYRSNPQKLAEWLTASHIERRRGTKNDAPSETPKPPTH